MDFQLPDNLRLGHLAEKIVSEAIKASTNYRVLYENVQLIKDKTTIGELDLILEETASNQVIHLEMAYKFYLFDPTISSDYKSNWIGPNRNDSLVHKLGKLKDKQFPLLYHSKARETLANIKIEQVSQALCFLTSLYIPFGYDPKFSPSYQNAVKGYYLDADLFFSLDNSSKTYYIPVRKEWGIDPSENKTWTVLDNIKNPILQSLDTKQALLIWQKERESFKQFFIVWWS